MRCFRWHISIYTNKIKLHRPRHCKNKREQFFSYTYGGLVSKTSRELPAITMAFSLPPFQQPIRSSGILERLLVRPNFCERRHYGTYERSWKWAWSQVMFKYKSCTEKGIWCSQKCRYFKDICISFGGRTQINSKRSVNWNQQLRQSNFGGEVGRKGGGGGGVCSRFTHKF